ARSVSGRGGATLSAGFERIEADLSLELPTLAPLEPVAGMPLRGSAAAQLAVAGPLTGPTAKARLRLSEVAAAGLSGGSATLTGDLRQLAPQPAGTVAAELSADGMEVQARSAFALRQDALAFSDLVVRGAGAEMSGNLSFGLGDGIL